mgnify:CR=1 FL=1
MKNSKHTHGFITVQTKEGSQAIVCGSALKTCNLHIPKALVYAAPELLEALKALLPGTVGAAIDDDDPIWAIIKFARNAIAKAEGGK